MHFLRSKKVFAQQSRFGRWMNGRLLPVLQGSLVGILAPIAIAVFATVFFYSRFQDDMKTLAATHIREQMESTRGAANKVSTALSQVHTGIRTVALLDGIQRLNGGQIDTDTQATISQIHSNLSLSLGIGEINIHTVSKDRLDKTFKFDSATAMRRGAVKPSTFDTSKKEIVSTFDWFAEKFPRSAYASLMDYPARFFGSDTLYYAVPFFGKNMEIAGVVTCSVPRQSIIALLPNSDVAIVDPITSNLIHDSQPGAVESSKEFVLQGAKVPNQLYSESFAIGIPDKKSHWSIWTSRYDDVFYARQDVQDIKQGLFSSLASVWLITIATILGIQSLRYRQERRFQSLVRNSQELIFVVDLAGQVLHTIGQVEKLSGWKPKELKGLDLKLFLDASSKTTLLHLIKGVTADEHQTETGEILLERQEGGYTWYEATSTNMLEEPGIGGILLTLRNIEARKNSERMMIAAKEAAERANEAKSEFLSRMSHELRTPLNAILGFGQLLEMGELDQRDSESVEQIMKAGRHLLNLVNDILDIARIETRKISLSIETVSCEEVFTESVTLISPMANREGIAIHVDCASDLFASADNQRLKQVLLNLLSNAVKYNNKQGEVFLAAHRHGSAIHLSVRDTGNGIDAQGLRRLFTPFDRLGADRSSIEGSGLGLALSKTMVEAMGGQIEVESIVNQGTTFTVIIPIGIEHQEVTPTLRRANHLHAVNGGGNQKLLYIEDNLANLKLVRDILEMQPGFELITAVQGGLGIEMAQLHRPDVILLDLDLPDISGLEVLKSLRENATTADARIIIMSADASENKVHRVFELGADDYLPKPINIKRFIALLEPERKAA
jgi:PAS domain S-box-containing protein